MYWDENNKNLLLCNISIKEIIAIVIHKDVRYQKFRIVDPRGVVLAPQSIILYGMYDILPFPGFSYVSKRFDKKTSNSANNSRAIRK